MSGQDLGRRLGVAAVGIPLGVSAIYLGVWTVAGIMAVVAAIGATEIYRLAEARGVRPFAWLGVPVAVLFVLSAAWMGDVAAWGAVGWAVLLALVLVCFGASVFLRGPGGSPLLAVGTTVLGAVYVGGTLGFAVHLRRFPGISEGEAGWEGALVVIFVLVATWCGDSGAYFAGHRWGRHKLIPSVSPAKTVEGAVGGLAGAAGGAALFALLFLDPSSGLALTVWGAAGIGLLLGAVAQLGDLVESLLKREAGVKDSGTLLPGHGGVLDRFDAVFFALPAAYLLLPAFLP